MIQVNTRKLAEAIREADVFRLPEMTSGTAYLFEELYERLTRGKDVTLSSLDFNAFESDDINSLNCLHTEIFERNYYTANGIKSALRQIEPVCRAVDYV